MSFLLGLAFRNLLRNLRRTVITGTAVVAGVAVLILGWGFVDGLDENVIRAQEEAISGHVLLRPDGYPTDGLTLPLDEARVPGPGLLALLADPRVEAWTERLWFTARLVSGADSLRARGLGYDPVRDAIVFPRTRWEVKGTWPEEAGQIAVGEGLAGLMDLRPGAFVAVEARTRAGALNALQFTVSGIVRTRNAAVDNTALWMPMPVAEELVRAEGARTHLGVTLKAGRRGADAAKGWLGGQGFTARTATEEVADLLQINQIRRRAISLVVFILMAIAATGIANTVIMATYERVREIGTLRAMGMGPASIRLMFLFEGAAMGLVAALLGALLGGSVVSHYARNGIDLSRLTPARSMGDFSFSTLLFLQFRWEPVLTATAFGLVVAVVASLYPAHHAATLNPADAVRAD